MPRAARPPVTATLQKKQPRVASQAGLERLACIFRVCATPGGIYQREPLQLSWRLQPLRGLNTEKRYSPAIRERAVQTVLDYRAEHAPQRATIGSLATKFGCTPETLWRWVRQAERDRGLRVGVPSEERERIKELEREVKELRQANEMLCKASAYFARAELDRRFKPRRRSSTRTKGTYAVEPTCKVLPIAPRHTPRMRHASMPRPKHHRG